ncbi:hypothetical protein [Jiella avicenniae]|uniref:UrcA family protein n=1 Tax=Jiella avicenniae TaxID=2907202 RepID=A0A9X1P5S5_9HYPH|nr:hypothetical protein [Jiella avicenniae]MCE7029823.1 hypothetical protein [Jiella avicenniae]
MLKRRRRLVASTLAVVVAASAASAQTAPAAADDPVAADEQSMLVEVSLGDWGVKTSLASKLSRKISDIPLTVTVSPDIAHEVCPIDRGDLDQQAVVSPRRTCAAKKTTEALESAVRDVVPAQ